MAMTPEIKNRRASDRMGGASTTMNLPEVKAELQMKTKSRPRKMARMFMGLSVSLAQQKGHRKISGLSGIQIRWSA